VAGTLGRRGQYLLRKDQEVDGVTDLAGVFSDLVRFETRLYNTLNERLRTEHGLTAGQFEFLQLIAHREGCRVHDVAAELAITTGAVSKGVDRLESAGRVRRAPHPTNRRSSVLTLTDAGRALLDAATPTFEAVLEAHLAAPLRSRSVEALSAAVARLRGAIEDAGLGTPTG
jgi:MarR family multiple antibiotic resistance transcriptional regulator